jgi:hypothetical protein
MRRFGCGPRAPRIVGTRLPGTRPMRRLAPLLAPLLFLATACGVAHPWPYQTSRSEPHVVLMVGDSYLGQTDATMVESLERNGFAATTVIDAHLNGSGLLGSISYYAPDGSVQQYESALAWLTMNLDAHPEVDTVVIEYGGACGICNKWLPTSYAYGSPEFFAAWRAAAHEMIDHVHSRGKLVVWAISPKSGASGDAIASGNLYKHDVAVQLSNIDRDEFCAAADGCADWWTPLVDVLDSYQTWLEYDGAWHKVRFDDLVHLVHDGSVRTSSWTVSALGTLWSTHETPRVEALGAPTPTQLIEAGDPVVLA